MGLTKSPTVTEKKVAANRQNAQKSTGPQTEAGKQNSSLNGLVHGLYSQARTYAAMVALGENPVEFERHRARLHASWGFGLDPLFDAEIDELAWLLWRKQRVEGARDSILVARKEQADTEGRRREREYIRDSMDQEEARRIGLRHIEDSPAAFEQTLVVLEVLKEDAERRNFANDHASHMLYLYGEEPTERGLTIKSMFRVLTHPEEEKMGWSPKQQREVLLDLIEEEQQEVEAQYALFRRDHIELTAWAKGAMLAPDEGSRWIIQEAASLDRAIDRKIKLLMELRKDLRQQMKWEAEARGEVSGVRCQEAEAEAGSQESGVAGLDAEAEARGQESGVRGQEAEAGNQEPTAASSPRSRRERRDAGRSSAAGENPVDVVAEGTAPNSGATQSADQTEPAGAGTDSHAKHGVDL